ncbi:hypothetical protein HA402_014311 [Bradysia odoriphaga]|nr:hypothetical protein HA402_014311 [Bradysia odoriphaga]
MNWLKVFRIVLITDSVVSVLKLALPIHLIIFGIQWKQEFDKKEKYDSSILQEIIIFLHFMATTFLLILILLRLVTNYNDYNQYQYDQQGCYKTEAKRVRIVSYGYFKIDEVFFIQCSKVCCCGCCWFIVNILSIAFFSISIWIRLSTTMWINEVVAISFLCWDVIILCITVIFKSLMSKITYTHVVQYEKHESPTEEISAGENSNLTTIPDKSTGLAQQ